MRDCVVYLGPNNWKERAIALIEAVKRDYSVYQVSGRDLETLARLVDADRVAFAVTVGEHLPERRARLMLSASGIQTIVLDLGYFDRPQDASDVSGYNQAGWDRIGWIPDDAPGDRWAALGLEILEPRPVKAHPERILALGQVEHDSQHGLDGEEIESWLYGASARLRFGGVGRTRAKMKLRPHPKQGWRPLQRWGVSTALDKTLEEDLAWADVVVTYNSTAGLEAIRQGIPVLCSDRAFYAGVTMEEREKFFHRVAYAQWKMEELRDGTALEFLMNDKDSHE